MNKIQKLETKIAKVLIEFDFIEHDIWSINAILKGHFQLARKNARLLARTEWDCDTYYEKLKETLKQLRKELNEYKSLNGIKGNLCIKEVWNLKLLNKRG